MSWIYYMDTTLYTDDNEPIPYLQVDVKNYLDKTTLIFGGSGSGKTTMIEEIMYDARNHIPIYLVIAPITSSEPYKRKLPHSCIKEDLTKKKIIQIWERQTKITEVYKVANDLNILAQLFDMCAGYESKILVSAVFRAAENHTIHRRKKDCKNNRII
jgi:ABC-type glutathione transport system ATPase component